MNQWHCVAIPNGCQVSRNLRLRRLPSDPYHRSVSGKRIVLGAARGGTDRLPGGPPGRVRAALRKRRAQVQSAGAHSYFPDRGRRPGWARPP